RNDTVSPASQGISDSINGFLCLSCKCLPCPRTGGHDVPGLYKVKGLVYIAARAPEAGEDYPALTKKFPAAPVAAGLKWRDDGFGALSEQAFIHDFAGDLPESEARAYYAVQQPMGKAITQAKTSVAAWHSKPSWYAVSTEDHTINPDLQRFMAKRMHAQTIELKASHVSLISQPQAVANLIMKAAHVPGY
ncbi:MAG: alpha/beta hydrolase, partial [Pantoea sp. Pent]|nr:alpha/beta hydrolase [Pantoea sp. Pent]